ncbi:MAG: WG repeat-containing protein [Cyanobacteria bacterium J06627_28]
MLVDISPATGRLVDGYSFLEERFPLKIAENGKIGFIDKTGNFVIPPQFDSVGGFHSGFSVVCQTTEAQTQINQPEELCGYIDRDGEWALAPKLKLATLFIDDVAVVQFPEQLYEFSIINNKSFQPLVDAPIDTVGNYYAGHPGYTPPPQVQKGYDYPGHSLKDSWNVSSGLLQVRVSGCEDKSRTGASPLNEQTLKYEYWNPGSGTYGFVDVEEGGFAIEPQFCHGVQGIGDFFEDRAFVSTDFTNTLPSHLERWRGHTVMIDPQGNIIDTDNSDVLPDYTRRGDRFHEGLCSVSALSEVSPNLKRRGYVDRDGEWVIQPQFKEASSFSEGLAAVQDPKTMKYGFIDKRGEYVIPPQFENAKDFLYGLAPIQETDDGEWGYINARGKVVIEPSFYEAEVFWSQNLAEVKSEGVTNFIDKKGKYILPPLKSVITTPLNEDLISVSYLEPSESNRRVSLLVNASGSILPYRPFNPRRTYHHDDILSLEKSDGLIRAGRDLPASQFRN